MIHFKNNKYSFIIAILFIVAIPLNKGLLAQEHPHIIISNSCKQSILNKIEQQSWAKAIYLQTKKDIEPYVLRHQTDPEWILSRYLMNRSSGKHYTHFISDEDGTKLVGYSGNAPYPTVRVSPHKRSPVGYRLPGIEELTPYDTSMTMMLQNVETKKYERIDPQAFVGDINSRINIMAYKAGVLYWLTGEDKYAKFASDLLDQWVKGIYYQQPIEGPGRVGLIDIQTLGDEASKYMIFAYDFVQPYMKSHGYDLSCYESSFEKIAKTLAFHGYVDNNWYAAESSTMVAAALALENKTAMNYYLQFYLSKDTIKDGVGQIALPTTVKKWLTKDGHWREPGGYHNYPVSKLLESALLLENNGYEVFNKYPQLLQASYAMLTYSFPDLKAAAYGDTGRPQQSTTNLEIGLLMANKYKNPIFNEILSTLQLFQNNGYDRSKNDIMALLNFLPEIPNTKVSLFQWNRSEYLDFAQAYYQRNGMDRENGMMYGVHGATYNHNHANGMSMELYGKGAVTGADAGNGPNYEHPMHVNYYTEWAAHNTVVAGGASSPIPHFKGGGGTKNIGKIELVAMEPMAKEKAISERYSFTDTKYFESSTQTNQRRTMAIVRVSDTTGYYVDIFRSDNPISNDYLFHNEGDQVLLYDEKGEQITLHQTSYPKTENDFPGLRFLTEAKTTNKYISSVKAQFIASESEDGSQRMDVWMPASSNKYYYTAYAPVTKTVAAPYNHLPTPVLTMRTEGKDGAWKDPFIALFEPSRVNHQTVIQHVSRTLFDKDGCQIAINVLRDNGGKDIIFHSLDPLKEIKDEDIVLKGVFAVISKERNHIKTLYLGKGTSIGDNDYVLKEQSGTNGLSASLVVDGDSLLIQTSSPIVFTILNPSVKSIRYTVDGSDKYLNRPLNGTFTIPLSKGKYNLIISHNLIK